MFYALVYAVVTASWPDPPEAVSGKPVPETFNCPESEVVGTALACPLLLQTSYWLGASNEMAVVKNILIIVNIAGNCLDETADRRGEPGHFR